MAAMETVPTDLSVWLTWPLGLALGFAAGPAAPEQPAQHRAGGHGTSPQPGIPSGSGQ